MKCPIASFALVVLLAGLASPLVQGQSTRPITEHGLEQSLRLGGLKEAELISVIDRRGVDFLLDSTTQNQLTAAGASPAVIEAVRTHYKGPDSKIVTAPPAKVPAPIPAAPIAPSPVRSTLPQSPGIYVQRGSVWTPLHQESAEYTAEKVSRVFGKASGGLLKLKGDVNADIAGEHSGTSVPSPSTFLIRMPGGMSATDYLLVHTHGKHDNREFKISAEELRSRDSVDFRIVSISGSALQIEVAQGAGDYAFVDTRTQPATAEAGQKIFLYTFQVAP